MGFKVSAMVKEKVDHSFVSMLSGKMQGRFAPRPYSVDLRSFSKQNFYIHIVAVLRRLQKLILPLFLLTDKLSLRLQRQQCGFSWCRNWVL